MILASKEWRLVGGEAWKSQKLLKNMINVVVGAYEQFWWRIWTHDDVWFIKGEAEERGLHPWKGHKVGNELLTCLFVGHVCPAQLWWVLWPTIDAGSVAL